jgi:hypothetical protein
MSVLRYRPKQRLSYNKKNEEWRKQNMDYWCHHADQVYSKEWKRMHENYLFHNNIFDQREFQKYCDVLGLDVGQYTDYVEPFNKLPNKINTLAGEERKRPFSYHVMQLGEDATNEVLRGMERDFRKYIEFQLQKEIEAQQLELQKRLALEESENPSQTEEEFKQKQEAMMQEHQAKEAEILDIKQIKNKYRSLRTKKEKLLDTLLRAYIAANHIVHKKNEGFIHANIAGVEAAHVYFAKGKVNLEVVNPLGLAFHKSPEQPFIHKGDAVTYKREMSIGDVFDTYKLEDKHLKQLDELTMNVYGMNAKMYSKDGFSPSHYENNSYRHDRYGNSNVLHSGSHGQSFSNEDYLVVYTTYWKSQRKIGILEFTNDYGDVETIFVDEAYEVPSYAETEKYTDEDGKKCSRKVWTDPFSGIKYKLKWDWVPQIWKGTRIEENIYLDIEPLYDQEVSILDPQEATLPILGVVYNSKNAPIVSTFDRGKHWQKLFLAIMHKWTKLIMQDKSVLHAIDTSMLDKKVPLEVAMRYALDSGLLPYNSLQNAEGAGILNNTRKISEPINLSNPSIERYVSILQYIDNQIGEAMGVTKPREGQMTPYSTATDNQQSIIQSSHITETVFALHDLLWEEILNVLGRMLVKHASKNKGVMRELLNDEEIAIVDLGLFDEFDEFNIRVKNSQKIFEDMQFLRMQTQALIQNDENALKYIISIVDAESMVELKEEIYSIQAELEERRGQMMQAQQQAEEAQRAFEAEQAELAHERNLELEMLKIEGNLEKAKIDSFKFVDEQDSDNNNIPDQLEISKFQHEKEMDTEKLKLEGRKLDIEEKKITNKSE